MRSEIATALVAFACVASGCRVTHVGEFDARGFYHARGHYRVRYAPESGLPRSLLTGEWLLENFTLRADGAPQAAKWAPQFTTSYALDSNNDGVGDETIRAELYDLRYVHRGDGSVIWARTLPMGVFTQDRELAVIARDYVDRVGGGSYVDVDFLAETPRERRVGTRLVEEGPAVVGGQPAQLVVFDILSLEQREVNPEHIGERVMLVMLRPGTHRWRGEGSTAGRATMGMMLVIGYAARAESFAAHRSEFEGMLGRLDVAPESP